MGPGTLLSIHITPVGGGTMQSLREVRAYPGKGLEGDRYFLGTGTYSKHAGERRELTLIEIEAIEALQRESDIALHPGDARRNLVTRGVALNHWVGRRFRVGGVTLRGIKLCEPCAHLGRLTEERVFPALVHRGGLNAQILTAGTLRVGDAIEEDPVEIREA
jgi:MOSC domain-containing protein YiiM